MVVEVGLEDVGSISDAALGIRVVLTGTPLPDLSVIDMSFAGRVLEAQE